MRIGLTTRKLHQRGILAFILLIIILYLCMYPSSNITQVTQFVRICYVVKDFKSDENKKINKVASYTREYPCIYVYAWELYSTLRWMEIFREPGERMDLSRRPVESSFVMHACEALICNIYCFSSKQFLGEQLVWGKN